MSLDPQWNERLSKTGRPEQPLRANTVRIRMEQTISRGITTDVRARGRYFSGFCWAMYRVSNSSITVDLPKADKRDLLEGIEEILGLASYYRQLTKEEQQDGLSGVTGSSNISDDLLYDGDTIDLDSFALLDNSPYAIRRFQSTLGNFFLKQGEFALTAAGDELAQGLDEIAGQYFEPIVSAVRDDKVSIELLDDLADAFTHQGIFTSTDNEHECDTLQRILFGVVSWDERSQTVKLDDWPSTLDIPVREHYRYIGSDEQYANDLQDSVCSKIQYLRRAWCLAILRAHQILATTDDGSTLAYDKHDIDRFSPFRPLGRVYHLQGQLAHALRAQLWGLSKHLEREAPEGVPREELLNQIESAPIAAEIEASLQSSTTLKDDRLSQGAVTRELLVAGTVDPSQYDVTVPESTDVKSETLADLRGWLKSNMIGTWRPTTDDELNGRTLIEATENSRGAVESATTRREAIDALGRLIGRSTVQLVAAIEQYQQLVEKNELLKRYVEQRFGDRQSSLVQTSRYIERLDQDIPLATLARRLFDERVITIHDNVVQDRLGSGSISLVFGTGADAGEYSGGGDNMLFAAGGVARPSTGNLRYRDLRRLMRDAGLLRYQSDTGLWVPTVDGKAVINRFRGEYS